jgi:hypothetical protein
MGFPLGHLKAFRGATFFIFIAGIQYFNPKMGVLPIVCRPI